MISQNQEIEIKLQILENNKSEKAKNKQMEDGESSELFIKTITRMKSQKMACQSKTLYQT